MKLQLNRKGMGSVELLVDGKIILSLPTVEITSRERDLIDIALVPYNSDHTVLFRDYCKLTPRGQGLVFYVMYFHNLKEKAAVKWLDDNCPRCKRDWRGR